MAMTATAKFATALAVGVVVTTISLLVIAVKDWFLVEGIPAIHHSLYLDCCLIPFVASSALHCL